MQDKKRYWIEIYFDAEDVQHPALIGKITTGLWTLVKWELDDNREAIIESSEVLAHKLGIKEAIAQATIEQKLIIKQGHNCHISRIGDKNQFPMRSREYEFIGYDFKKDLPQKRNPITCKRVDTVKCRIGFGTKMFR